jgi:hypothetical protein
MARLAIAFLLALPFPWIQDRIPVPAPQAQKEAEALIKSLFKEDYAKRTPEAQLALAKKLLQQGRQTGDDPAAKYVLYREAVDLAAKAGDFALALEGAKAIGEHYDVEPVAVKAKVLMDAPATFRTPDLARGYAELCLIVASEAIAVDGLEDAKGVLVKAEGVAKTTKDLPLVIRVQKQRKELDALQNEAQKAKVAEVTLQTSPDDPASNLSLGRYLFAKGKLEQAVAHLAKGSDPALKAAAEKELAVPTEGQALHQLANAWWDAAERESGLFRKALQERARDWYEAAYAASTGLQRMAIAKRLDAVDRAVAPPGEGPPTLKILTFAEFDTLAVQYPREQDVGAKFGKATASSQYQNRDPNNVFKGNRRSDAWTLGSSPGWFEAKWDPPVRGRTLLLVGRNVPLNNDQWGADASLTLNGSIKLPLKGMTASRVIIVELGTARRLESLRLDITANGGHPGLGTVEVFR